MYKEPLVQSEIEVVHFARMVVYSWKDVEGKRAMAKNKEKIYSLTFNETQPFLLFRSYYHFTRADVILVSFCVCH